MKLALITLAIYAAGAAARDNAGSIVYCHPSHRAGGKIRNVCDSIRINKVARTKCGIETPAIATIMLVLSIHLFCSDENNPIPTPSTSLRAGLPLPLKGRVSVIPLPLVSPDMAEIMPSPTPNSNDRIKASRPNSMDAGKVSAIMSLTSLPVYLYEWTQVAFQQVPEIHYVLFWQRSVKVVFLLNIGLNLRGELFLLIKRTTRHYVHNNEGNGGHGP